MNSRTLLRVIGSLVLLVLVAGGWWWAGSGRSSHPPAKRIEDLAETAQPRGNTSAPAEALPIRPANAPRRNEPASNASILHQPRSKMPARLAFASAWESETQPALAAFNDWTNRWRKAAPGARAVLLAEGVALAQNRRAVVSDLIRRDPQQANASAVPMTVRAQLPPEVLALLEERVSGTGELALNAVTPAPGVPVNEPIFRTASVDGKTYRAYVYGRRLEQATKPNISLLGVALDGAFAVSESPLRVLESGETLAPGVPVRAADPLPGQHMGAGSAAIETAGAIVKLCCTQHIADYETQLIRAEDAAGPYELPILGDSGPGTANIAGRPPISWSHGTKKMLFIRVDFSDKTGPPVYPGGAEISDTFIVNEINGLNQVRDSFAQGSFQKTTLSVAAAPGGDSPDVTQVFRMAQPATYYALGDVNGPFDQQLHDEARAAATVAGINLANYDRIGVIFSHLGSGAANANPIFGSQINYGGRAQVQGKNFWINGWFNFGTVVHELGHTYGLLHANLWKVGSGGNPVSPAGQSEEYGDPFSPMGTSEVDITNHFSHWEKSLLQWIPDSGVTTVGASGTYRIHRFNHPNANLANQLALKIVRNGTEDYWIGFSPGVNGSPALTTGAYVMWGYNAVRQSDLLDLTTPGANPSDAPLAVGATFNDTAAGLTIQPLATGGTAPNEWLDVQITVTPRIQWSAASYSVDEKLGAVTLTVTRSNGTAGAVTVNYATADGSALAGTHYTAKSGQVSWAAGEGTPKTIAIPIATSPVFSGLKSFAVTLSGMTGGGVITGNATATVNIASAGTGDPLFTHDYIDSAVKQVVAQPDGKLLIAGWFGNIYASFPPEVRGGFARLNTNGTLDLAFGNGTGADALPVSALALQPDGKVLIGGNFANVHGTARTRVARLLADGSVDPTFNPGTGPNGEVRALALQPDGKILIGGVFTSVAGETRGGIARLNADGTLDTTFVVPVFSGFPNATIESIALQSNGQPVIAGGFYIPSSPWRSGVARLTTTGALDATFNPGFGAHIAGDTGFLQTVQKVAVLLDGRILVGGYFSGFNGFTRNRLARLSATGTVDATFVPSIDPTIPVNDPPYPNVHGMFVQADGRIVIGGTFSQVNGSALSNFARINGDGTVDTTFGVGSGSSSGVNDFTMQADGQLVLATDWGTIQGTIQRAVARLFTGVPGLPGTVQFSAPTVLGSEGNLATITASRNGGSYGAISVNYATIPGAATAADFTANAATLQWANGDATSRTINIPLTADGTAEPEETFTLNLGIPLGGTMLGAPGLTTVTVTTAFQAWRRAHFTTSELADLAISGDHADPNGNGLVNLLDFALGVDPKLPSLTNAPAVGKVNISGSDYLTLSIHRVPTATDLTYTPQSGASLGIWNGAPVQIGSPVANPDGTQTVTFRDNVPITPAAPKRFMRLEVTRQP